MPKLKTNRDGCREIEPGKWEVNFRPYNKAKRVYKYISAEGRRDAQIKRAEEVVRYRSENKIPHDNKAALTFDQIRECLREDCKADKLAPKTVKRYLLAYNTFCRFLEQQYDRVKDFDKLTTVILNKYKIHLANDEGRTGIRSEFTQLRAVFGRLKTMGHCDKSIFELFKEIKKPPAGKKDYIEVSDEAIKELLKAIKEERPDYFGITYFLHRLGFRIGETTLIRKGDIKFDKKLQPIAIRVYWKHTKTNTERIIEPIDKELAKVILQCYGSDNSEWLFPNRNGNPHNYRHYEEYLARKTQEVTGVRLTPHDFRHRFCTEAGKKGVPIPDIQRFTGHKDPSVLLKYYSHSTVEGRTKVLAMTRLGI